MALLVLKDSEAWVGVVEGEDASMVVVNGRWKQKLSLSEIFLAFVLFLRVLCYRLVDRELALV